MRVLVTGGAGFIGSHLCERLLETGSDVLCIDNFFTGTSHDVGYAECQRKQRYHATQSHRAACAVGDAAWRYENRLCSLKLDSHRRIRLD